MFRIVSNRPTKPSGLFSYRRFPSTPEARNFLTILAQPSMLQGVTSLDSRSGQERNNRRNLKRFITRGDVSMTSLIHRQKSQFLVRVLCALALVCTVAGFALGQPAEVRISVEEIDCPTFPDDIWSLNFKTGTNANLRFLIEARSSTLQDGASLGFKLYHPTGALPGFELTNLQLSPNWTNATYWPPAGASLNLTGIDGNLPEFWLIGGVALSGGGFQEDNFVDVMTFDLTVTGDFSPICIDSAFVAPAGNWLMSPGGPPSLIAGNGDGGAGGSSPTAFCFTTYTIPCIGPQFTTCVDSMETSYCSPVNYQLVAVPPSEGVLGDDPLYRITCGDGGGGVINYLVEHNGYGTATVNASGGVTYTPSEADSNTVVEITVNAYDSAPCLGTKCTTRISVTNVCSCCVVPGDADGSGSVNIGDATFLIAYIFTGGPPMSCCENGDADGNATVNIGDVTHLLAFIFSGGSAPNCGPVGTFCGAK